MFSEKAGFSETQETSFVCLLEQYPPGDPHNSHFANLQLAFKKLTFPASLELNQWMASVNYEEIGQAFFPPLCIGFTEWIWFLLLKLFCIYCVIFNFVNSKDHSVREAYKINKRNSAQSTCLTYL